MNATLSRSDVLKPLAWLIGLLVVATTSLVFAKAPEWLLVSIVVSLLGSVFLYVGAYVFCLVNDRDALRSEKYSLHKMAIEHGIYGDSDAGVITVAPSEPRALTAPDIPKAKVGGEQ
jgi:hypothetical protein